MLGLAIAGLVGAGITAAASLIGNKQNQQFQKEVNAENLAFQREQFEEQKYLNRNSFQIQSADMRAAGINPAMANGATLSSGSFNSNQQASTADYSPFADFVNNAMSIYSQQKMQKASDKNALDIANVQADTQKSIAEQQLLEDKRHNEQMEQIQRDLADSNKSVSDATLKKINSEIADIDESFNGKYIQNEDSLFDLYKTLKTGMESSDGSVVGTVLSFIRDLGTDVHASITGDDFAAFKKAYTAYLRGVRSKK